MPTRFKRDAIACDCHHQFKESIVYSVVLSKVLFVQLPDWRYPVVCNLSSGELKYDNYNGRWGEQQHLDSFLQSYAIEKTKIESRCKGHSVTESQLSDGSVKLTINVSS